MSSADLSHHSLESKAVCLSLLIRYKANLKINIRQKSRCRKVEPGLQRRRKEFDGERTVTLIARVIIQGNQTQGQGYLTTLLVMSSWETMERFDICDFHRSPLITSPPQPPSAAATMSRRMVTTLLNASIALLEIINSDPCPTCAISFPSRDAVPQCAAILLASF